LPESRKSRGGSGEKKTSIAAAPVAPRSPSSSSWRGRRRSARGTRSPGSSSALAASSHGGERRTLSGKKGKTRRGRESTREEGEAKHGFTAVLQDRIRWHGAAWNVLGVEVASTASAPRHRAAWQRGVEDDRGVRVGWAGWRGGPRPRREVSFSFFLCLIFPFFFIYICFGSDKTNIKPFYKMLKLFMWPHKNIN
jgi:hypothetical protein